VDCFPIYEITIPPKAYKTILLSCVFETGLSFVSLRVSRGKKTKTPWSVSASELYRPSDRRLSAKRLPTFAHRGCHVVSVTDPNGRILGFLDRSRYFSIK
jgi:hypothetical protein